MKKSTIFAIVFIVGVILFNPTMKWIDQIMLKSQLKEALIHYAKDYCGQEITITSLDVPIFEGPLWEGRSWYAESKPEITHLNGSIRNGDIILFSSEKCNSETLILNREERIFIYLVDTLPTPQHGINSSKFFAYLWAMIIGLVIWLFIYSREQKKKTKI
jgi:hypothetical protein